MCVASGTPEKPGSRSSIREVLINWVFLINSGGFWTPSRTADAKLDCAVVVKALIFADPKIWERGPLASPLIWVCDQHFFKKSLFDYQHTSFFVLKGSFLVLHFYLFIKHSWRLS